MQTYIDFMTPTNGLWCMRWVGHEEQVASGGGLYLKSYCWAMIRRAVAVYEADTTRISFRNPARNASSSWVPLLVKVLVIRYSFSQDSEVYRFQNRERARNAYVYPRLISIKVHTAFLESAQNRKTVRNIYVPTSCQ